jgi:hypothetical protein
LKNIAIGKTLQNMIVLQASKYLGNSKDHGIQIQRKLPGKKKEYKPTRLVPPLICLQLTESYYALKSSLAYGPMP